MSAVSLYASDVVALARKDLKLELRARDTLPAMLLFVLSTLAVFHFALPTGTGEDAAYGLLWIAIIFTALLGLARAWAPEREGGALDGLVLAPCDRSAIWLGKSLATLAFLGAAEIVAIRRLPCSSLPSTWSRWRESCSRASESAPSARSSRQWLRSAGAAK